ncbi:unnamed protein product, partial [Prorocentrum cordatum]
MAGAGRGGFCAGAVALALYVCPWTPVVLIPCCAYLCYAQKNPQAAEDHGYSRSNEGVIIEPGFVWYLFRFVVAVALLFGFLMAGSLVAMAGEAHFVQASFLSVLTVRDLTPNVGIFWYIFILIFDRYRTLFLFAYHAQLLFFPVAMLTRVARHRPTGPFLYCAMAVGSMSLHKPYPTASDYSLMITVLLIQ